jgi:hypothetical protein
MKEEIRECKNHGETLYKEYSEGKDKKSFRCLKCRADSVRKIYKRKKKKAVDYLGGKCTECGYKKCLAALEFHHLDPTEKDLDPSRILNRSWENILIELDKCILVCSNCHKEIHNCSE